jgi:hypothetical protein
MAIFSVTAFICSYNNKSAGHVPETTQTVNTDDLLSTVPKTGTNAVNRTSPEMQSTLKQCTDSTDPIVEKVWMLQETYILNNRKLDRYQRGVHKNTMNFDRDELILHCNGTGIFRDIYEQSIPLTWAYTDERKNKMTLILEYPTYMATLYYSMIHFDDGIFYGTLNYIDTAGEEVLVSFKRVLKGDYITKN